MKFLLKGAINNILALVQVMGWRRPGDKPLFEFASLSLNAPLHIDGLEQDFSISIALAMEILQSCTKAIHIFDQNLFFTLAADVLAPDGDRPSANTVLTANFDVNKSAFGYTWFWIHFYSSGIEIAQSNLWVLPALEVLNKWTA